MGSEVHALLAWRHPVARAPANRPARPITGVGGPKSIPLVFVFMYLARPLVRRPLGQEDGIVGDERGQGRPGGGG